MESNLNFNINPYYDDFDEDKNFHRILFKPGYAVQARELTQLQTILQSQIEKFGKHVFKEGTIILGGAFDVDQKIQYVKVKDRDSANAEILNVSSYVGKTLTGTSGVKARVIDVVNGTESNTTTKTVFVAYTDSGNDQETSAFSANEVLTANNGDTLVVINNTGVTGSASRFTIDEGTLFVKNHFVNFEKQSIILENYSPTPNLRVGFSVIESVVNETQDTSLLDPALGSYNYSAPGADRYKIEVQLNKAGLDDVTNEDFVELLVINNGIIEERKDRTLYSVVADELAKRTMDESGDYYVRGMDIVVREHLDNGENLGYLPSANGGNTTLLAIGVEPGVAYVKGYEVGTLVTKYATTSKGNDFNYFNDQVITGRLGNYVNTKELIGSWDLNVPILVNLYDQPQQKITLRTWTSGNPTGNVIGTAKVKGVEYISGTVGSANAQFEVYLFDINMTTDTFSNVKSIYSTSALSSGLTTNVSADIIQTSGITTLQDTTIDSLLYYTGSSYVRTIKDNNDLSDTTYTYRRTTPVTVATSGTFTLSAPSGEIYPYTVGALSDDEKRLFLVTATSNASVNLNGTVSTTNGSNEVVGLGTDFTELNVGDKVQIGIIPDTFIISSVSNATYMYLTTNVAEDTSGNTITKVYRTGDAIDFTVTGNTGVERTITASSTTSLSFDFKEKFVTSFTAAVTTSLVKSSATEIKKTLRPNAYVSINCATAGTTGPFNLGFSDVFKINSIRLDTTDFTTNTQGTLATSDFVFDNGQRDEYYDHAKITPKINLSTASRILVSLDYFEPDFTNGTGFFSVDSYPVDDVNPTATSITTAEIPVFKSPSTGFTHNLRDYIDFRPVKVNTGAWDAGNPFSVRVTNPATTNLFQNDGTSIRFLEPSSQISYDYSAYLGRKDVVALDKDGNIVIIKGVPAINTITPIVPSNLMALAVLDIPPYPSLSPPYASILGRIDLSVSSKKTAHIRQTMRDINVLKQRVENLEYYTSLNLLEKDALNMLIPDQFGLDRFKNGLFVDNFNSDVLAATYNPDLSISFDTFEKVIRPRFENESIMYNLVSNNNTQITNNLVTMPYTEVSLLEQPYATTTRNIETSVFRFIGTMLLNPETDVWVDTQQTENKFETVVGDEALVGTESTKWNSWQTNVTGVTYNLYDNKTNKLIYSSSDVNFLREQAKLISRNVTMQQNKIGYSGPKLETRIEGIETSTSKRIGTEIFYEKTLASQTESENKLLDVSINPYIRPQIIKLIGRGLKANTRFYTFFDNEDMSEYVTPTDSDFVVTSSEGSKLTSGSDGYCYALLRLPTDGKRFRFGTKSVKFTDSPSNDIEATSYCEAFFVAQGLIQQKSKDIYSTYQVKPVTTGYTEQTYSSTRKTTPIITQIGPSCMAYSFYIDVDPAEEGIFLTSVDVFIQSKSSQYGVWFEIKEVDADGGITQNVIPYSEVWFRPEEVVVSDDASVPLNVKFNCPIFLYNQKQYAFIIHTEAINPDYYFWVARLGQTDIITNQQFVSRKLTGTLYTTNNNLNWDIVPITDLKVKFNRASFNTNVVGTASFGNKPIETFKMGSTSGVFKRYGETIKSGDRLTLANITGGTISTTDFLVGQNSNVTGEIITISGSTYATRNTNYETGETVDVYFSNGASKSVTAVVTGISNATGILRKHRTTLFGENVIDLENSSGNFDANDKIYGVDSGLQGSIQSIDGIHYSLVDFEPCYLNFKGTTTVFRANTTSNATNTMGSSYDVVNVEDNTYFTEEKIVLSRTKENSLLSGANSSKVLVSMNTSSEFVSPVLDLNRFHSVYVHNIVNANTGGVDGAFSDEEGVAFGGTAINKYISRIITLAEGQDAEDLLVKLTAYRPPSTKVHVYAKIIHAEDSDTFDAANWVQLRTMDVDSVSSIADDGDFIELDYKFPDAMMTGTNGEVQYTNSAGITFSGFKEYQIKIVLTAENSALVPKVGDLRTVALQM
jgi:hypothetical protein